ncbi:MAG TPA: ethanolamine ammonia-lyase subunit EutC [Bryobacteraceae bacterium]|jgi:ethanolamine ammonia-lyase small subunit|nr:ethanolamine ammonia-lyase subunit EutC [Bryobacteraceae bacterium]
MRTLRDFTSARVDLPTAGNSIATAPLLELRLAHARARDAVHLPLDASSLSLDFRQRGWPSLVLQSQAKTRDAYLRRPDRGRVLSAESREALSRFAQSRPFAFIAADGLSALAVDRHAAPLLAAVFTRLDYNPDAAHPVFIAQQARVAIGDVIGECIGAELAIVLIGERPGLSSPDSLGIYITWAPRTGRTEAERNCLSNVHANGLSYEMAAHKLAFLVTEAKRRKLTGVALKESAGELLSMNNGQRSLSK